MQSPLRLIHPTPSGTSLGMCATASSTSFSTLDSDDEGHTHPQPSTTLIAHNHPLTLQSLATPVMVPVSPSSEPNPTPSVPLLFTNSMKPPSGTLDIPSAAADPSTGSFASSSTIPVPPPPLPSTNTTTTTSTFQPLLPKQSSKTFNKAALNIQIPPPTPLPMNFRVIQSQPTMNPKTNNELSCSSSSNLSSVSSVSSPSTVYSVIGGGASRPTIESGLIENITSKKKRGTTRENIILMDSILRERRDIFYAMLNNVSKIRIYRKNKSKKSKTTTKPTDSTLVQGGGGTATTTSHPLTSVLSDRHHASVVTTTMSQKKKSSSSIDTGNEYVVKLNNGLKCEAYEKSTTEEMELYGHKRQFKISMYYTQNEMDRAESDMMDPSPLIREDRFTFLDQLRGLKPSIQTYRVIDLVHPYHLFTTELEIIEPKSGRLLGRVLKKTLLKTHYLIQTVEGKMENDKPKYNTLFTLYKQKKKEHHSRGKEDGVKKTTLPSLVSSTNGHTTNTVVETAQTKKLQKVLDFFVVFNLNEDVVATITRKCNPDYEKKGYFADYHKVHFLFETTPYERTLMLSAVFLLDIEHFGN
ncbi:hypothetical protein C9374_014593 [Naegleria lovaniensis]|uniref:Uncharacterized protein n=1 Tax=Naegleria lovaniensis TaxID=51637 RepID=A0AA88GZD1_NAELO|nr:uncharacterized protein C9374_014593 [Naegleria lovaniensis]KAG2389193.1 hypothetical protein C9374_014593 [Naegleria lovaniensis]